MEINFRQLIDEKLLPNTRNILNMENCSTSYNISDRWPHCSHNYVKLSNWLLLGLLALASNVSFLIIITTHTNLRKSSVCVYLIALSCVDVCTTLLFLTCFCFILVDLSSPYSKYSPHSLMNSTIVVRNAFQFISLFLITLIAFERYKSICRPLESLGLSPNLKLRCCVTTSVICISVVPLTIISAFASLPLLDANNGYLPTILHSSYVFISLDVITLLVVVLLSYKVIKVFKMKVNMGDAVARIHRKQQRQLTIMVLVNSFVFLFLVLFQDIVIPFLIISGPDGIRTNTYFNLVCFSSLLNSGINPIIYNIFGSRYRKAFSKTFKCCKIRTLWHREGPQQEDIEMNTRETADQHLSVTAL